MYSSHTPAATRGVSASITTNPLLHLRYGSVAVMGKFTLLHLFTIHLLTTPLCKLMEYCLSPAITALQDRLKENELRLSVLQEEAKQLEAETQSIRNDSPRPILSA
ncbi:hypothetical protein EJB05_36628, partial [Eragrostis curvula]